MFKTKYFAADHFASKYFRAVGDEAVVTIPERVWKTKADRYRKPVEATDRYRKPVGATDRIKRKILD